MTDYTELLREIADELGAVVTPSLQKEASRRIEDIFESNTDEITLPLLTLKIIRAVVPLFQVPIPQGSEQESTLVYILAPLVADTML